MLIHSQTAFDFKLEVTKKNASVTSFGGLPLLRQALRKLGLVEEMKKLTLDLDGTLIETHKREALYSYEGTKAYQPMNVYCPELSMVIAHEFRDGNVSPAEGYQRLVERFCRGFTSRFEPMRPAIRMIFWNGNRWGSTSGRKSPISRTRSASKTGYNSNGGVAQDVTSRSSIFNY